MVCKLAKVSVVGCFPGGEHAELIVDHGFIKVFHFLILHLVDEITHPDFAGE